MEAKRKKTPIIITDHDTFDAFLSKDFKPQFNGWLFPGAEFRVYDKQLNKSFEILGYYFDINDNALLTMADSQKKQRYDAMKNFVNHLNTQMRIKNIDHQIDFNDFYSGHPGVIMKTQLVDYVVKEKKYFKNKKEFLGFVNSVRDSIRMSDWRRIPAKVCIDKINNAGGFTVLSHPILEYKDEAYDQKKVDYDKMSKNDENKFWDSFDRTNIIQGVFKTAERISQRLHGVWWKGTQTKIPPAQKTKKTKDVELEDFGEQYVKKIGSLIRKTCSYGVDGIETYIPQEALRGRYHPKTHVLVEEWVASMNSKPGVHFIKTYGIDWHGNDPYSLNISSDKMMSIHKSIIRNLQTPSAKLMKRRYN